MNADCPDLSAISNGQITYTPPRAVSVLLLSNRRYGGTIATYSCSPGYQLVIGTLQRVCGQGSVWNGTEPACGEHYDNYIVF